MAVKSLKAHGGIAITASHNPIEWNALKLIDSSGMFLDESQGKKVLAIVEKGEFRNVTWDQVGKPEVYEHAIEDHIRDILKLKLIDIDEIASRKFKVVVDCVNGAGGTLLPALLQDPFLAQQAIRLIHPTFPQWRQFLHQTDL